MRYAAAWAVGPPAPHATTTAFGLRSTAAAVAAAAAVVGAAGRWPLPLRRVEPRTGGALSAAPGGGGRPHGRAAVRLSAGGPGGTGRQPLSGSGGGGSGGGGGRRGDGCSSGGGGRRQSATTTTAAAINGAALVTSTQNGRVKAIRHLLRRRAREREGLLLLEGHRLVADALASAAAGGNRGGGGVSGGGSPIHTILGTRDAVARLAPDLAAATARLAPGALVVATPDVVASVCDTVTPQGVVAVVDRPAGGLPPPGAGPSLLLVLDGVGDPGNVGTLVRSAAAAGATGVVLTHGCADVWSPKALRAGMGAQLRLPVAVGLDMLAVVALARERRLALRVADGGGTVPYDGVDWRAPALLVVGGEASGPSPELLAAADEVVAIPLWGGVESLNAAVAGSVVLYEARRQRSAAGVAGGGGGAGAPVP